MIHPFQYRKNLATSDIETASRKRLVALQGGPRTLKAWLRKFAGRYYNAVLLFPDRRAGWIPVMLRAFKDLLVTWKPDVIYASGPPFSTLWGARLASNRSGIPWIAEYRDRWTDDPYRKDMNYPWFRERLEAALEAYCIKTASCVVTVSDPWVQYFNERFGKEAIAVFNGFDPNDFPLLAERGGPSGLPVRVFHVGSIYPGRRDPTPLFRALKNSGIEPGTVEVCFVGLNTEFVEVIAEKEGVTEFVKILAPVSYNEAKQIQYDADVLLILQSIDVSERGNIPAKLFEYFATLNPILGIGLENGEPARLIAENDAALFSTSPDRIGDMLRQWIKTKERDGYLARLPESVRANFERDVQFERLETYLCRFS